MAWDAGLLVNSADEVHHVNEVRSSNRLDNFEIKSGSQHALDHAENRGVVRNQYGVWRVKPREKRASAPKIRRTCAGCGLLISLLKRRDAKYCSSLCQVNAWKRAHR